MSGMILQTSLSLNAMGGLALFLAAAGMMSGLSGFGFSAIGAASLLVLPPSKAIPLLMVLSMANQLTSFGSLRKDMKPLKEWFHVRGPGFYILGSFIGAPAGVWILTHLSSVTMMSVLGIFLLAYAAYNLRAAPAPTLSAWQGPRSAVAVGALGGLVGGFSAFPGCAPVIWSGLQRYDKATTRAIVQPFILVSQCLALALLVATKPAIFDATFWLLLGCGLPIVLPFTLLGVKLYRRLSETNFKRVTYLLLGGSGGSLVAKSAIALGFF
jgi:uncharacterized membrane protein YfcA